MLVIMAMIITGVFIHLGFGLKNKSVDALKQKERIMSQNISMSDEIEQKQVYKKSEPKSLWDAFASFVNQSKMFEIYGGTQMKLVFSGSKENENIEDRYVETEFRNVKGLPLTINVSKFSSQTDMAEVLNDIYLLESRTDFKISEILTDNDVLTVKGELYGI
jgi:hypothetical protein